jgi:DNA polymerase-1
MVTQQSPSDDPRADAPRDGESLYLIDTSGFVFRAYHALPPLTNARGLPTGAVYGFTNMLFRLLDDHQPDYLAAIFDSGRAANFRREVFPEYKANRPPAPDDLMAQFPLVQRVLDGFRIPRLVLDTFEADDLIATLTEQARAAGISVTVVSSDKDLMQLVGDRVRLLDTMKDRIFDTAAVREKFGVDPGQLGDWLALVGDSSDNVPGVPSIGAKTATKLLAEHGDLETLLARADQIKGKRVSANLQEFAEQARLSRQLVELQREVPLSTTVAELRRQEPDKSALWRIFGEFEFGRLRPKVAPGKVYDLEAFELIDSLEDLDRVVEAARAAGRLALTLELTSRHPVDAAIVGVGLCWGRNSSCYIPLSHSYLGVPPQLREADVLERLRPLLALPELELTLEDSKLAGALLGRAGVEIGPRVRDALLCSYVLDPQRETHELERLALDQLGHTMLERKREIGKQRADEAPVEIVARLAAERAQALLDVGENLQAALDDDPELAPLIDDIELPLARILAEMETRGCLVDVDPLRALSHELASQLATIEADVRQQAGWSVNLNSPKQLQKLLFEQLGLSTGRKTKTGFSTDADVLADLAIEHPIAAQIEEFRGISKLKSGYLDALPSLVNRKTGRVHTFYNQAVTATGRLSSSEPNMQNIPVRTEVGKRIRGAFVAPEGRLLLSADYSQIELRVLAHLSKDPVLIDAFERGQDVHTRTAAEVFDLQPEDVDAEQRRVAKAVNFGVVYGQTDWGLARQLRIPKGEAGRYIEGYFERYAGVKTFMEQTIAEAKAERVVRTLLGRRRPLPDINSRRWAARSYAERIARNTPIQGTAADLLKLAMIRVQEALDSSALDAPMILTVHDELVFEVLPERAEQVAEVVRETLANVYPLAVPLVVDIAWGRTWADAH